MRRNETAEELADYIRANTDVPVVIEGDTQIGRDHPVAASFLALLQLAAHPGDRLAWKHLCMTPALADRTRLDRRELRKDLVEKTLSTIYDHGFTRAFEDWLDFLKEGGFDPDPFSARRIEQLRQATREFDLTGERGIEEFVNYALAITHRETPANGVVQIMTIHKSKGLGFDAVIAAEIEGVRDDPLTDLGHLSLVPHREGQGLNREIGWVLSMPRKDVCQLDPTLSAARLKLENEEAFEELCVLYVALTRAKFANYVVCTEPDHRPTARALLVESVGVPIDESEFEEYGSEKVRVACRQGRADWFNAPELSEQESPSETIQTPAIVTRRRRFQPLRRQLPSALADDTAEPKEGQTFIFTPGSMWAADYGTKVHELFELIDWMDDRKLKDADALLSAAIDRNDNLEKRAKDEVMKALCCPEVQAVFDSSEFGPDADLWLEKRFELIHEGVWISGTFDRVTLARDESGNPQQAWIHDFKTNRLTSDLEMVETCNHYAPQMKTYRLALGRMLGLDEGNISSHLIFTRTGKVREVR